LKNKGNNKNLQPAKTGEISSYQTENGEGKPPKDKGKHEGNSINCHAVKCSHGQGEEGEQRKERKGTTRDFVSGDEKWPGDYPGRDEWAGLNGRARKMPRK